MPACRSDHSDDEYLSDSGCLDVPSGHVSILSGYVYSCRLFRRRCDIAQLMTVLGEALEMRRRDRRRPPSGLASRARELDDLQHQVEHLMDDCPLPLRLPAQKSETLVYGFTWYG